MKKREFIKTIALAGISLPVFGADIENLITKHDNINMKPLAENDDFWTGIRGDYYLKPEYINLENGYYNMLPQSILEKYITEVRNLNKEASYYMRTKMTDDLLKVRTTLASFLKVPTEELIVTRNTTESMDTVISGIDWKSGDEAIMAEQDYGSMLDMFAQQAKRYGMINKIISIPLHPKSDEEIVKLYEDAITPKTKLFMVCHMINISGHILPIKKICEMAHRHGVEVIVDGAHTIAHIDFNITDLGCDYYASSLHKWLSVPLGAGMLYVKQDKISKLWPLFGERGYPENDIRKLNHTGTQPIHAQLSIIHAIEFHQKIGIKRKEDRLRYIQQYWTSKVKDISGININTPLQSERSCGIANVGVSKLKPAELQKTLLEKYKIWTVAIDTANVHGVRITPGVYTTTQELDVLVKALKEIAQV